MGRARADKLPASLFELVCAEAERNVTQLMEKYMPHQVGYKAAGI